VVEARNFSILFYVILRHRFLTCLLWAHYQMNYPTVNGVLKKSEGSISDLLCGQEVCRRISHLAGGCILRGAYYNLEHRQGVIEKKHITSCVSRKTRTESIESRSSGNSLLAEMQASGMWLTLLSIEIFGALRMMLPYISTCKECAAITVCLGVFPAHIRQHVLVTQWQI